MASTTLDALRSRSQRPITASPGSISLVSAALAKRSGPGSDAEEEGKGDGAAAGEACAAPWSGWVPASPAPHSGAPDTGSCALPAPVPAPAPAPAPG
ncbi:hypothetical protein KNE206_64640 [Kitasatospora sp. NE20-6]